MKIRKFPCYLLAAFLVGCGSRPFVSSNPLCNEKDIIFEKKLLGCWVYENTTLEIKQTTKPPKSYNITFVNEEKLKWLFNAFLLKLDDKLFIDISIKELPYTIDNQNNFGGLYNAFPDTPIHTFVKIESIIPQLVIRLTDRDTFENLLKNNSDTIKCELTNDYLLLTTPAEQLHKFIVKYADDERVFGKEFTLNRKIPNAIDSKDNAKEK
ncbi:MAG: hypothetical protein ACYSSI_05970 [Planctomycetota bacterium]|jgi:hypothetical protein